MQLEEFFNYKNKLMEDILTDESITELLVDEFNPDRKCEEFAYTQVFPYEYVPETAQEGHTFICFDVDIQSVYDKTFLKPAIYIWIFTHKSKMRLPEGGVRTDKICSEINKKINGSRFYGLGRLELSSSKRFAPVTDFQGRVLTYITREVNQYHNANQKAPSNRFEGV